jgi:hypothetical protein
MNRTQLEHIIRASGAITEENRFVVIGSQAILGPYPNAPPNLLKSMEADVFPPDKPDLADLIDGSIGEDSPFHETFGYYAHGIGPETAVLPNRWKSRLISIKNQNTNNIEGLCISPVDLAISKLIAGREKDKSFVQSLIEKGMVSVKEIDAVSNELEEEYKQQLIAALDRL